MKRTIIATALPSCLAATLFFSCSYHLRHNLSQEECARLVTVPDSCFVDTAGIVGAIFPAHYSYQSPDSSTTPPVGTWTPTRRDVIRADRIFQAQATQAHTCLDSNTRNYYRQYVGLLNGSIVLIHGIRKSHDIHICGHRSFWINVYENDCSTFDAEVNLRSGSCTIEVKQEY